VDSLIFYHFFSLFLIFRRKKKLLVVVVEIRLPYGKRSIFVEKKNLLIRITSLKKKNVIWNKTNCSKMDFRGCLPLAYLNYHYPLYLKSYFWCCSKHVKHYFPHFWASNSFVGLVTLTICSFSLIKWHYLL